MYGYNQSNEIEILLRIASFFIGIILIIIGLLGRTPFPDSFEGFIHFLENIGSRGLMVIVGLFLVILGINPSGVSGKLGLSKKY